MFIIPETVMRTKSGIVYTQIAIFPWANVGLLLYTLLGQRWKLTLAQMLIEKAK
jgi:hypothetical protein